MKSVKILLAIFMTATITAASANTTLEQDASVALALKELNYSYPELARSDNFIKQLSHDKVTGIKVFISKNMPSSMFNSHSDTTNIQAVACNADNEDEVCTTTTKNGRIVKQSCECVGK